MPQKMNNLINKNTFGQKIKKLRKDLNLSQVELANILKCTRVYISSIENGKSYPGRKTCQKFADFFNVSIDWLLNDTQFNTNLNKKETELVIAYRAMNQEKAKMFLKLITDSAKSLNKQ